jgi:hypothetical protein
MQHVSHQTALALRDAGFLQPEIKAGQIWYDLSGESVQVTGVDTDDIAILSKGNRDLWIRPSTFRRRFIFAPTAPDILRGLGPDYFLRYKCPDYRCELIDSFFEPLDYWQDENPAEACAKAWLAKSGQSV